MNYFDNRTNRGGNKVLQACAVAALLYCGNAFAMDNMDVDDELTYNTRAKYSRDSDSPSDAISKKSRLQISEEDYQQFRDNIAEHRNAFAIRNIDRSNKSTHNPLAEYSRDSNSPSDAISKRSRLPIDYQQFCDNIAKRRTEDVQNTLNRIDLSTTEDKGYIALWYAIQLNDQNLVKELVEHGADLNNRYKILSTHLIQAIGDQRENMIKCLVECGADVDYSDGYDTPLTVLANGFFPVLNSKAITEYLVSQGADINKVNKHGDTPLLIAVKNFKVDLVKCLVDLGADVNKANVDGDTPLSLTEGKKFEQNEELYSEYVIDFSSEGVKAKNQEIRKYLIEHGAK